MTDFSDYFYPFAGINPFDPPDMKTFVYAPDVRILIARGQKQYDVSRDVIRGSVIRKENSASTLFFTLANKGDYNGLFHRMDRVVVFLKRVRWQQVFSGYLDTVPFAQLYGGQAEYKATCTLKRLLHTWWSPTLTESQKLFQQEDFAQIVGGDGELPVDSGLGGMLRRLLTMVGGWQPQDVHIQDFPLVFYEFLQGQLAAKRDANQAQANEFKKLLLGPQWNQVAPGNFAGWDNHAGPAGPSGIGEQHYIAQIIAACDALGLGPNTADLTNSQQVAQVTAEAAAGARDPSVRTGLTQFSEIEAARNEATINSDAAILGVACAMVETGGGTTIRNLANPAVPDSLRFPNDGPGFDHDSIGIFQQRQVGWGLVSQRMDPRQAATMFFNKLPGDWRNLPPGVAIQRVQQSGFPERYAPVIPLAAEKVRAYREAQRGMTSTIAATPLGPAVTAAGSVLGITPGEVVAAATSSPTSVGDIRTRLNKPNPDSEAAVQEAYSKLGSPYIWDGEGPNVFDCSGLMTWCFKAAGKRVPSFTWDIKAQVPSVPIWDAKRGDMILVNGGEHVVLYLGPMSVAGPDMVIEAAGAGSTTTTPTPGQSVQINPAPPRSTWLSVHRVCENGGEDPSTPRLPPALAGPGTPAGTGDSPSSGAAGGQTTEPIAVNLFSYFFTPDRFASSIAEFWTEDHKDFLDAEPLIQMVQTVARASLRNFASAPTGDFMAYVPDYFGLDGKKAIVSLEDIELKDVKINFSDDNLTTHVYVAGDNLNGLGDNPSVEAWLQSAGSVTVEHEWLFERLRRIAPGDLGGISGSDLMRRFGVRPLKVPIAMAGKKSLELLLASQIFMEKWAQQYQTTAQFSFLPELFPGMRVILSGHDLQVYVSEVTHTFDWENGFSTSAVIMAPSRTDPASAMAGTSGRFGTPQDSRISEGLGFNDDGTTSAAVMPG